MKDQIINYLSNYTNITKELEQAIDETTFFKHFPKGTILLKEGAYSNECYFVLKGCIRSYFLKDGNEKTVEFYEEEQIVTPPNYGSSTPSNYFFECLEDVIVSVGNPSLEKETFKRYPALESLSLVIAEVVMAQQHETFVNFKTSNPEERYLMMLAQRPKLIQRASHHQVASYLGIQPESLSRIRKRIKDKPTT